MNLFHVFETGNIVLITTFIILILMSLVSWYIIVLKVLQFRKRRTLIKTGNIAHLIQNSEYMEQTLDEIRIEQESGLIILATISSSAPFIGLFGTVWGIYGALISISSAGSVGLEVVAAPMGEALVATAIGLFAAVPASIFYNILVRQNKLLMQRLRHLLERKIKL
jgi:biopolymer transport protein ExbB